MTTGQRLKKLRESTGMSQKSFGAKINLSQGAINRYENDQSEPSYKLLRWYADYFNVTTDWILGRTDDPNIIIKKIPSERGEIVVGVDKGHEDEVIDPEELLAAADTFAGMSKEEVEAWMRSIARDELDKGRE